MRENKDSIDGPDLGKEYKRLTLEAGQVLRPLALQLRSEIFEQDTKLRSMHKIPKKERSLCGAQTRSGSSCQAFAVFGGSRCRVHGGEASAVRAAALAYVKEERRKKKALVRVAEALS